MKKPVFGVVLFFSLLAMLNVANAEDQVRVRPVDGYLSLFGGIAMPFKADLTENGVTAKDAKFSNSAAIGGKAGLWLTAPRKNLGVDVGFELDVTNYGPDLKAGQVLNSNIGQVRTNSVDMNATFIGVNVLARLPMGVTAELPNGRWFPYLGFGGGVQRLTYKTSSSTEGRDPSPAFQALGGFKIFLIKHLAVFGEVKFTHASHTAEFQGAGLTTTDKFTLNTVHGVGGLSVHF